MWACTSLTRLPTFRDDAPLDVRAFGREGDARVDVETRRARVASSSRVIFSSIDRSRDAVTVVTVVRGGGAGRRR